MHLGYKYGNKKDNTTGINLREQDGYNAYFEVVEQMIQEKIEYVVVTGDFFHTPTPTMYCIQQAQKGLYQLAKNGIKVYILAGNHDATDSVTDLPSSCVLDCKDLNLFSYSTPYEIIELKENVVLHLVSHHSYILQDDTMKKVKPIKNKFNILCTHGSCFDTEINAMLHTEASPREIVIPEKIMNMNWDYTLLGHIHERCWIASKDKLTDTSGRKQFYAGSLIRRGFSDRECKLGRGWTLWEIQDNEMLPKFFKVKQRPQIDHLINCENKENIVEIEKEILNFFESIKNLEYPIIRIVLLELDSILKLQLNWKQFNEYTEKCLYFTCKIKTKEELKEELENYNFSFDLFESFNEFWESNKENYNEKHQDKIKTISTHFLKKGNEKVLKDGK